MFSELKKFSGNNPVFLLPSGNKLFVYTYVGNTIGYYSTNEVSIESALEIPNISLYNSLEEILESDESIVDETPFDFDFDNETESNEISANNFVKAVSEFTKFYNTDDYRPELTGLHIRKGTLFASDATIMRLKKTKTFPDTVNMIVDVNPLVDYLGINTRNIKTTGKSLFGSKAVVNDMLNISTVTKDDNDSLKIDYKNLSFLCISVGKSNLSFEFIKTIKPTHYIKLHRKTLIKNLTQLVNNPSTNSDAIRDYVRFTIDGNLSLTNFVYYDNDKTVLEMNCNCEDNVSFVLHANKLMTILKTLTDSQVEIQYMRFGNITRIISENSKDLLLIAQTTYK
jgi:hypothetical protein